MRYAYYARRTTVTALECTGLALFIFDHSGSGVGMAAVFDDGNFRNLSWGPQKKNQVGGSLPRAKMPSHQIVAVELVDFLSEEFSVRIVARDMNMRSTRGGVGCHKTKSRILVIQILVCFRRSAFPITDTLLNPIAALAIIGLRRIPKNG